MSSVIIQWIILYMYIHTCTCICRGIHMDRCSGRDASVWNYCIYFWLNSSHLSLRVKSMDASAIIMLTILMPHRILV